MARSTWVTPANLQTRERTPDEGRGGSFTAARRPVTLAYSESLPSLAAARAREAQLSDGAPGRRKRSSAAIEREFVKVNGAHLWSQRVFWIVLGALSYIVCRLVIGAAASVAQALAGFAGGSGSDMGYAGLAVTCAGWIAAAAALYRHRDTRPEGWTIRPAGAVAAGVTLVLVLAASVNFASEVVLFRVMPLADVARGMFLTSLAARITAVLVPLVMFMAMLFRMRDRINVPD